MIHEKQHPLKGQTVVLNSNTVDNVRGIVIEGAEFVVDDWWDRINGGSWMYAKNNWAAMHYGMRSALQENSLPLDDEVVYGKIGIYGHIVHASELGEEI